MFNSRQYRDNEPRYRLCPRPLRLGRWSNCDFQPREQANARTLSTKLSRDGIGVHVVVESCCVGSVKIILLYSTNNY